MPLTILQDICRISNLNSLIKLDSAPPEVKKLCFMLDKNQSKLNKSSGNPIQASEDIYHRFVEYLRREKPMIDWVHHEESGSSLNKNSPVVSPWWIYHKTVHWKNKTFTIHEKHVGDSIICFHQNNMQSFGRIINIFTVNDPYQNITEYFMVVNPFEINHSFMTNWPHLNMYQARATSNQVIITCEDIDCHCSFYEKILVSYLLSFIYPTILNKASQLVSLLNQFREIV